MTTHARPAALQGGGADRAVFGRLHATRSLLPLPAGQGHRHREGHGPAPEVAVLDAGGTVLPGKLPAFSTSDAQVVEVDAEGVVTAVGEGSAVVTASVEGVQGTVAVEVGRLGSTAHGLGEGGE